MPRCTSLDLTDVTDPTDLTDLTDPAIANYSASCSRESSW